MAPRVPSSTTLPSSSQLPTSAASSSSPADETAYQLHVVQNNNHRNDNNRKTTMTPLRSSYLFGKDGNDFSSNTQRESCRTATNDVGSFNKASDYPTVTAAAHDAQSSKHEQERNNPSSMNGSSSTVAMLASSSQQQPTTEDPNHNYLSLYGQTSNTNSLYNNNAMSPYNHMMGSMLSSPYNSYGYGMGGAGLGMMGGGMMMGGYGVGVGPPWLSNLNQFLLGVQTVIFSLGQAIQIVGMNTNAIQHLLESITGMFDHAVATFHEMQRLEIASRITESEEDKKRRRRLKALRYTMVTAATYAGYRLIKRLLFQNHRSSHNNMLPHQGLPWASSSSGQPPPLSSSYPYHSTNHSNPYHYPQQSAYSYPPPTTGAYPY